jgi:dCTP deaminase
VFHCHFDFSWCDGFVCQPSILGHFVLCCSDINLRGIRLLIIGENMLLNDKDIRKLCLSHTCCNGKPLIEPFSESVSGGGKISFGLTHAGYDVRLSSEIYLFLDDYDGCPPIIIDPKLFKNEEYRNKVLLKYSSEEVVGRVVIPPHSYILGVTIEHFNIPRHIKARVVGKSTLCRCGILINSSPAEPGWSGRLVLEIGNITSLPACVYVGEGIAQMEFEMLSGETEIDYGQKEGQYQNQTGVTFAKVKE